MRKHTLVAAAVGAVFAAPIGIAQAQ